MPAIGGPLHVPHSPILDNVQEFYLPPSPAVPAFVRPPFPQIEKTYETDHENLRPGVIKDLELVSRVWALDFSGDPSADNPDVDKEKAILSEEIDVLSTLKQTTHLIRSVRNYLLSLPDESPPSHADTKPQFRPSSLNPTPIRRVVSNPASDDPLSRIRRSALDVLTALRAIEETTRLPLSDDAYDAQSDHASSQSHETSSQPGSTASPSSSRIRSRSPSQMYDDPEPLTGQGHDITFAISVVRVPGRSEEVPVWADEEEPHDFDEEVEKREIWDERLVLGGGYLYKQDVKLSDLSRERKVVWSYVGSVDEVLFGGRNESGQRGWQRASLERARGEKEGKSKSRRTSLANTSPDLGDKTINPAILDALHDLTITEGNGALHEIVEEDSVDDEDLPAWAKRSSFIDNHLGNFFLSHRLYSISFSDADL